MWEELDKSTNARFQSAKPEYDAARKELVPVIQKEEQGGAKPIDLIEFQPVRSKGIFESEFASKGEDLIFHFWPWGYHEADRSNRPTPTFHKYFETSLKTEFCKVFGDHRVVMSLDSDVGAWFVKAIGWGQHEFARKNAIEACTNLHRSLGGE